MEVKLELEFGLEFREDAQIAKSPSLAKTKTTEYCKCEGAGRWS